MIKKLNVYFFDDEKPHKSDLRWFYGSFAVITLICLYVAMKIFWESYNLMNKIVDNVIYCIIEYSQGNKIQLLKVVIVASSLLSNGYYNK